MDYEALLEDAIQQVIDASLPGFDGKADAVAYYQSHYPGKGVNRKGKAQGLKWRQEIVRDLLHIVPAGKGDPEKSLQRRFDPSRLHHKEERQAKQYQDLARAIGVLKPPENGYHFHYDGGVMFSECEPRSFDIDILDEDAEEVAAHPERVIDVAMRIYMQYSDEDEAPSMCEEGDVEEIDIVITANPKDYEPPEVKQHKPAIPFFKHR